MPEIGTNVLRREELDRLLKVAKGFSGFKATRGYGGLSFERESLPDLAAYKPAGIDRVTVEARYDFGDDAVAKALDLADVCTGRALTAWSRLDIAESGVPFDLEESRDAEVLFGIDAYGPTIWVGIGTSSPGCLDLDYRRRLFNRSLAALGLSEAIEAVSAGEKLLLDVKPGRLVFSHGNKIDPAMHDIRHPKLVRVGGSHPDGSNFHNICLNVFVPGELRAAVPRLIASFGSDKVVRSGFSAVFEGENYFAVRDSLNESGFGPWQVHLSLANSYSLGDLDRVAAEGGDFLIHAFTIKVPKRGVIDASISRADGELRVYFSYSASAGKASSRPDRRIRLDPVFLGNMDLIESIISDLAGGPEFIERRIT